MIINPWNPKGFFYFFFIVIIFKVVEKNDIIITIDEYEVFSLFCSKCGGKIVEYTEFCSECGNKINNVIIKKSSNASSGQSKKHSLFNKKTIINSVIFFNDCYWCVYTL